MILLHVVAPDTFQVDLHVVMLFNRIVPETYKFETHGVMLFNVVVPETFNVLRLVQLIKKE